MFFPLFGRLLEKNTERTRYANRCNRRRDLNDRLWPRVFEFYSIWSIKLFDMTL